MQVNWQIEQMERKSENGFVITCHWRCTGVEGGFTGTVYATCSWQETPEQQLIPYDQLTEAQVLGWVWNSGVDKEATEAAVAAQIEAQKNPPIESGVPWSKA